ncbi:hypothetical protein AX17_001069 [Amanita inopinata Kibby_2008]|nr:hypothetical protein AX17_001069 [Amanita inopinata Kibby_2008]
MLTEQPVILRLSGWAQITDRLALREIAVQLNEQTGNIYLASTDETLQENNLDEDASQSLDSNQDLSLMFNSTTLPPSSHLPTLISLIPTLSRPTIVILDAFDLFTLHPRQSLLYCLFDTVQSCRAGAGNKGIAVIGITSRMDTINMLEKRVKSRFSGRMLRTALPRQVQDWVGITRTILCSEISSPSDRVTPDQLESWKRFWLSSVEKFLSDEAVLEIINDTFSITKDVRLLFRLLTQLIAGLSLKSPSLSASQFASVAMTQRTRPAFPFLHGISYPCICLLVAAVHWDTAGQPSFTFEMLYESFYNQLRASTSAPVQVNGGGIGMMRCSRGVMMSVFESLIHAHIFIPLTPPTASVPKEFVKYRCALGRDDIRKAVDRFGQTSVKKWLNKAQ